MRTFVKMSFLYQCHAIKIDLFLGWGGVKMHDWFIKSTVCEPFQFLAILLVKIDGMHKYVCQRS